MPTYTQANHPLEITTPLATDTLLLTSFRGEEGISRLFEFEADLLADVKKEIAFDKLLGQKVTIRLNLVTDQPRYFSGICQRFSQGEADNDFCRYQLTMVPQFWLLTGTAQSRIFQQQSVPDILKVVLKGLDPNVSYQLNGQYPQRNYCVQYRESDFDFACRLMEEEGIFYFFTHAKDGHKMIVADSPQSHPDLEPKSKLTFQKAVQDVWLEDRVLNWNKRQELLTGQFTLWDHSFELPGKNLQAKGTITNNAAVGKPTHQLQAGRAETREVYDYPGAYAVRFDGVNAGGGDQPAEVQKIFKDNERTVAVRQQQQAALGVAIEATSTCRQLVSGHKFTLEKHSHGDGAYVITSITHAMEGAIAYRSAPGKTFRYSNSFTALPLAVPFRPQRVTPRPFVQGTQTATVVGPAGQEIFTDKYGRVKVQFNWDRQGQRDAKSSCWVRVAQVWAGKRWGASFWPRIGQEVVVAFLEGNPDAPIIVGSVYNAEQMPPYLGDGLDSKHTKDNKVAGVKSNSTPDGNGFNEWRFDDTKDKEQFFLHAQRNMDVTVNNDSLERVYGNSHRIVGKDDKKTGDRYELVYRDQHMNIKRHQVEQVEGNLQLTVGKGAAQDGGNVDLVVDKTVRASVGQECHVTIGSDRNEKVGGNQSLDVSSNHNEKVGQAYALEAGQTVYIKGGTTVVIEAGTQLTLKVGGNFIAIGASDISIVGTMVNINSGGAAGAGTGPQPKAPTAATQAQPTQPTVADDSKSGSKSAP
jgi:type VI secretion system secreted protein VgrG